VRFLAALLAGTVVVTAMPAAAQSRADSDTALAALRRACAGAVGLPLSRERLAEAIILETRLSARSTEVPALAADLADDGVMAPASDPANFVVRLIEEGLAVPGRRIGRLVSVEPSVPLLSPGAAGWLFTDSSRVLTCAAARPNSDPAFSAVGPFALRGSVEALDDVGAARTAAAGAQIGWSDTRVTNLDGDTTRTESLTADIAIGVGLGDTDGFGFLYADYSRNRSETRVEGAAAAEVDEVDALELGLLGSFRLPGLRVTGRIAYTMDEVTDARYLRANLTVSPTFTGDLGICSLNEYRNFGYLQTRCTLQGEAELRHVADEGTATFGPTDTLFLVGGTAGFELSRSPGPEGEPRDGPVASVRYTYLVLLDGALPDVDRLDASLAWRIWAGDVAFDIGLTYADGTERKSFADEHRFGVRLGLLY
jgi:hypothetical protein